MEDYVKIFFAKPESVTNKTLYPKERQTQIENTKNKKLKLQRYFSWKLLEKALHNTFGINIDNCNFVLSDTGKWECDSFYFSISHTNGLVAVAISNNPVGLDVEERQIPLDLKDKVLTNLEIAELEKVADKQGYMLVKWTQKEAVFKLLSHKNFIPSKIDVGQFFTHSDKVMVENKRYCFTVASKNSCQITTEIYKDFCY